MARSGRRPGSSEARDSILSAARQTFSDDGYDGATIRAIARSAGVDPALVHHYFGNKEQLFVATMKLPIDPPEVLRSLLAEGTENLGERLLRRFLTVWDDPSSQSPFVALIRSASSNERAATMLREFIRRELLGQLTRALDAPDADLRATLVGSHLVGLGMARYVLRIEPLASAPADTLVAWVGPTIQRYLAGEID